MKYTLSPYPFIRPLLIGGRWHIIPNWQHIPLIYRLYIAFWGDMYATYHLWEPETTIDWKIKIEPENFLLKMDNYFSNLHFLMGFMFIFRGVWLAYAN